MLMLLPLKNPPVVERLQVCYQDLDPYGHVNNGVYLEYFESVQAFGRRKLLGRNVLMSHMPYWSYGDGEVVEGRAQDLLLAVCGRRQPAGRLTGAAADRLAAGSRG